MPDESLINQFGYYFIYRDDELQKTHAMFDFNLKNTSKVPTYMILWEITIKPNQTLVKLLNILKKHMELRRIQNKRKAKEIND
ncbi:hypothetical protein ABW636_12705 [Aquimarina sp. 2201CG1-2-11]|uniref:hypothetical protein n=1 Tax=Aquimarina discodermiae TaxID=3231043 RepID=UPI00346211BA